MKKQEELNLSFGKRILLWIEFVMSSNHPKWSVFNTIRYKGYTEANWNKAKLHIN